VAVLYYLLKLFICLVDGVSCHLARSAHQVQRIYLAVWYCCGWGAKTEKKLIL